MGATNFQPTLLSPTDITAQAVVGDNSQSSATAFQPGAPLDYSWAASLNPMDQAIIKSRGMTKEQFYGMNESDKAQLYANEKLSSDYTKANQTDWQGYGGLALDGMNTAMGVASYFDTRKVNNANMQLTKEKAAIMRDNYARSKAATDSYNTAFSKA